MSEERINLSVTPAVTSPQPGDATFITPTDVVPLPSRGICYPVDHPFHGVDRVEIKSMTAKEEDILTSRALLKQGKVMSALIRSCLLNKMVDADELLTGDRNAILCAIRVTGYGPEYEVDVACPNCGEVVKNQFDLSKLPLKMFPEDVAPLAQGANAFQYVLPATKRTVVFKLQTGASEREVDQATQAAVKQLGPNAEKSVTTQLFFHILSLDNETDRKKLGRLVETMPARDSRGLRNYMDKISPTLDMTQQMKCSHCDQSAEVDVPMGTEFFWPKAE